MVETGTPWIGVNWNFERRIELYPGKILSGRPDDLSTRFA